MRIPQHGVGVAFGLTHDRPDEFGLMLDQALHVDVSKERRQSDRGEDTVVETQHDARNEGQATVSFEHEVCRARSWLNAFSTLLTTHFPRKLPRFPRTFPCGVKPTVQDAMYVPPGAAVVPATMGSRRDCDVIDIRRGGAAGTDRAGMRRLLQF